MRLRLLDRVRRLARLRPARHAEPVGPDPLYPGTVGRHRRDSDPSLTSPPGAANRPAATSQYASGPGRSAVSVRPGDGAAQGADISHVAPAVPRPSRPAGSGAAAVRAGSARARVRADDAVSAPREAEIAAGRSDAMAQVFDAALPQDLAVGGKAATHSSGRAARRAAYQSWQARLPFTAPHARERPRTADGRRHCGSLERILWRQWDAADPPPREVIAAVDRLAELPERIKERLADGLDAIFLGPGGVPELDDMTALRGVRLPSGRASWDACAGAYGERKIVVGSQPSPTPDVMCHEIGHALDDLDSPPGKWRSDSAEFRMLYEQCLPYLASDFHRQPGGLGRKEFFADAFAAIASHQRPALVDMLSGQTRTALRVMLFFNRRYDI